MTSHHTRPSLLPLRTAIILLMTLLIVIAGSHGFADGGAGRRSKPAPTTAGQASPLPGEISLRAGVYGAADARPGELWMSNTMAGRTGMLAAAQQQPSNPTTIYTVNSLGDTGAGSGTTGDLRYCITQATSTGGGNTITFSVTGTINLLSALPTLSTALTINGPGAQLLTISRDSSVATLRIFFVTSSGTASISGLTLANGNATGGAAVNKFGGGTLNIDNCVLANNAGGVGGGGAIIDNGTSTINITNSAFTGNSASGGEGGAIRHSGTGTLSITGCMFSGNSATNLACLHNNNSGAMNVTNTVITGNSTMFDAGAISNSAGTTTVTGSTISNNTAGNVGGAIKNQSTGTVTVTDSTISNNTASGVGGAIYNNSGAINIVRSTVSANSGINGGGIYSGAGMLNLTNTTFSGNRASSTGGCLYAGFNGPTQGTITACTITGNSAVTGGGLNVLAGSSVTIQNTIIAGNTANNSQKDINGAVTSGGYNLIGNNAGASITPTTGDQIGTAGSPINPLLGPLQDNGGPTFTHALLANSPAIDAGNAFGLTIDQRGFVRTYDTPGVADVSDTTDIGAFELTNCMPLVINPASLPDGVLGAAYNQMITASGGAAPYTFAVTNGSLPANLSLATDGSLTGTPTAIGSFNFTITATDVNGCTGNRAYTLMINCPMITVNPAGLPGGLVGAAYTQTITASGGSAPYTFAVTSGTVPAGLTLNSDGTWSGTPTTMGNYNFTVTATDSHSCTGSQAYMLTIGNTCTWNGSASNNWNSPSNWTPGFVPSAPNDVVIPASGVNLEPTLSAAAAIVNNLTIASGRTLTPVSGQDMTINGILTLSGGLIDAGANMLSLGTAASISRTGGQVIGNLRKQFGGAGSLTYPVGTASGYSPVNATVTAGTGALTVKAVQGPQPVVDASLSLQRYWSLAGTGITVNLVFHYLDPTDIPAGGNDAGYRIIRVSGSTASIFMNDCISGSPCVDTSANTMTINGVTSFSDWTAGAPTPPTAVRLDGMQVSRYDNGVLVEWQTGFEADNLGFNVYRETAGRRELVNSEILAGSALVTGRAALLAGRRYVCWDDFSLANQDVAYWIEDLDLNGKTTLHGPVKPQRIGGKPPAWSQADVLSRIGQSAPRLRQTLPGQTESQTIAAGSPAAQAAQWELAGKAAVKLSVRQTGWYRVTQAELLAAGLAPQADPRRLQLFVDGVEQAMLVIGESDGRFDATDAVEFYGMALDTPATDAHVYWLVAGNYTGKRMNITASKSKSGGAASFAYTSERRDRTIYFSSLLNGEAENFFGAVVTTQTVDQTLLIQHLYTKAIGEATLEVALQGVTDLPGNPDHLVNVVLNGVTVGALSFDGREHKVERLTINAGLLHEGLNTVTLTAAGGSADVSLIDTIRITYAHTYTADSDGLVCTTAAGAASVKGGTITAQTISGFTTPLIRVLDITDPQMPVELAGQIEAASDGYAVTVALKDGDRTLLAFTDAGIRRPAAITSNQPSNLRQAANGADLLVITRHEFFAPLAPLVALRQSQGLSVALIDVADIYDEFSYGNQTVEALKDFIMYAKTMWKKKPQYVLLGGDASYDGRNYLGFGDVDVTPTKLIDTGLMETASDDWLADVDGDGQAELAVGRLPFRNATEAALIVAKITNYEKGSASEEVLLASDANEGYNFEQASAALQAMIPANLRVSQVNRGRLEAAEAKRLLIDGIHRKQKIVNYAGHGSVNLWRANLLTNDDALALDNEHLPVFVMMTCLNGYFDDPLLDSLGEALLKAEKGGAVAVWASSGMTVPNDQAVLNQALYRALFEPRSKPLTMGEATARAKAAVSDVDIRRTWILLGDPTTRLR